MNEIIPIFGGIPLNGDSGAESVVLCRPWGGAARIVQKDDRVGPGSQILDADNVSLIGHSREADPIVVGFIVEVAILEAAIGGDRLGLRAGIVGFKAIGNGTGRCRRGRCRRRSRSGVRRRGRDSWRGSRWNGCIRRRACGCWRQRGRCSRNARNETALDPRSGAGRDLGRHLPGAILNQEVG